MASRSQTGIEAPVNAAPVVADDKTETIYGVTLGELIGQYTRDKDQTNEVIRVQTERIAKLEADAIAARSDRETMQGLILELRPYRTLTILKDDKGNDAGCRLPVELDADTAEPYLAQAKDAGEDPQEYLAKQVSEALQAYSNS